MSRRQDQVGYVRVDDHWVRVERPAPLPQYDVFDLMGAAFFGAMAGVFLLAVLVMGK